jgi:PKD repeat protein
MARTKITIYILILFLLVISIIGISNLFIQKNYQQGINLTYSISNKQVYIIHNGGESIDQDRFLISMDTKFYSSNNFILFENNEDWPFSIGKTLVIPYTPSTSPQTLRIYYDTGTTRTEIFTATIPPETEVPTVTPTISIPVTEPTIPNTTPATIATTTVPTSVPTISLPPGPPQAIFDASPRYGPYPLTVTFTDLSTGSPDQWEWNFGDGSKSTVEDPVHSYTAPGTYTISLKVANAEGANTRIMQSYICVGQPETKEVTLVAEGPGSLLPGGFAQFRVTGSGARIKVGGKIITPLPGDTVRIILGNDGQGRISVHDPFILEWTFDDTEVEVNGQPAGSGRINDISIPAYEGFVSNLTLVLPPESMNGRLIVEGSTTDLSTLPDGLTLRDFFPGPAGTLVVDTSLPGSTDFQGSIATIGY